MKKRALMALAVFGLILILGCGKKESDPPNFGEDIIVQRVPSPDEALNALKQTVPPEDWADSLDPTEAISAEDHANIAFLIGVRSANALGFVFLDDMQTARAIGLSIQSAADRLNIRSDEVEMTVLSMIDNFENAPEEEKAVVILADLNSLSDAIQNTLEASGSDDYALLLESGGWFEMARIASSIIADNYSTASADILRGVAEAEYFKSQFAQYAEKEGLSLYERLEQSATEISDIAKQETISREDCIAVNEICVSLITSFEEGGAE